LEGKVFLTFLIISYFICRIDDRIQKLYLPKDIKNITFQRISKTLPSKGYQKLYLPKDIKNFTFQRISKTLPYKGYQKHYLPKDDKVFDILWKVMFSLFFGR
jgi:hypothetical protein